MNLTPQPRRGRAIQKNRVIDVTTVALGAHLSCALRRSGKVACWGLDDPTNTYRVQPMAVPSLDRVVEIVAGGGHACARRQDGSVWCWGNGWGGEDGVEDELLVPAPVRAIRGATALVSSGSGLLALQKDGRLVSCRYHVGQAESEASAKLLCRHETVLGASLLWGMSTAIHRPIRGFDQDRG